MALKEYSEKVGIAYTETDDIRVKKTSRTGKELLHYPVPQLSADGTCNIGDALADEPYNLRGILNAHTEADDQRIAAQLEQLYGLLAGAQEVVRADWIGIYQVAINAQDQPVLVKLAYEGASSRAEFPLTDAFAELSNNTKVGLTGEAVIIQDVAKHAGPYYTCDVKVQSEACLPIYNEKLNEIIGIIDAEAFTAEHFTDARLASLAKLCSQLAQHLPIK